MTVPVTAGDVRCRYQGHTCDDEGEAKMEQETVVVMDHRTPTGDAGLTVVFALDIPREPATGARLEFEGSLCGDIPLDLVLVVTGVTVRYAFGVTRDEHVLRTEIEAVCHDGIWPGDVARLLLAHPAVGWVDLNDGRGKRVKA